MILEGPCTYKVESRRGGYLELGKLTARMEKRGSGGLAALAAGGKFAASAKPCAANPEPRTPNPKPHNSPYPLFAVRTPTAIVTDLGTEFGVEVGENGNTTSHVFRGSVKVEVIGVAAGKREAVLRENESALVEVNGLDSPRLITGGLKVDQTKFVLQMPFPESARESRAYEDLVLSMRPAVYYRMERPSNVKFRNLVADSGGGNHHGRMFFGMHPTRPTFRDAGAMRSNSAAGRRRRCNRGRLSQSHRRSFDRSAWVMASGGCVIGRKSSAIGGSSPANSISDCSSGITIWPSRLCNATASCWSSAKKTPGFRSASGNTWLSWLTGRSCGSIAMAGKWPRGNAGDCANSPIHSLGIGCKTTTSGDTISGKNWHGSIDELALFNRALSAEEIASYEGKSAGGGEFVRNMPNRTTFEVSARAWA